MEDENCRYCPKPCPVCGGLLPEYEPWVRHRHFEDPPGLFRREPTRDPRYTYCSVACRNRARAARRPAQDAENRISRCAFCNTPIPITNHLRKFCSNACRQKGYRREKRRALAWAMLNALEAIAHREENPS